MSVHPDNIGLPNPPNQDSGASLLPDALSYSPEAFHARNSPQWSERDAPSLITGFRQSVRHHYFTHLRIVANLTWSELTDPFLRLWMDSQVPSEEQGIPRPFHVAKLNRTGTTPNECVEVSVGCPRREDFYFRPIIGLQKKTLHPNPLSAVHCSDSGPAVFPQTGRGPVCRRIPPPGRLSRRGKL